MINVQAKGRKIDQVDELEKGLIVQEKEWKQGVWCCCTNAKYM